MMQRRRQEQEEDALDELQRKNLQAIIEDQEKDMATLASQLAQAQRERDIAEAKARWIEGVKACEEVTKLTSALPPDILMVPMPLPDRLDYAAKMIESVFDKQLSGLRQQLAQAQAKLATDGPVFNRGRSEGRSDVATQLRKLLDPEDSKHLNLDGLLKEVEQIKQQLAQAQRTVESVQAEYQSVVIKDGEDIKRLEGQLEQAQQELFELQGDYLKLSSTCTDATARANRLEEQLAQAQRTIESVQAEYQAVVLKDGEDIKRLERELTDMEKGKHVIQHERDEYYAELEQTKQELAQAQESREHTKQWYGSRWERLKQWARHEIPEQLREQFFNIVANGTKDAMEPPPSIQIQLNLTKHERDELKQQLAQAQEEVERFKGKAIGYVNAFRELRPEWCRLVASNDELKQQLVMVDALRAELTAAREECERLLKNATTMEGWLVEERETTNRLRAENAELSRDKARLDLLERTNAVVHCLIDGMDDSGRITAVKWEINDEFHGATLREAIDAALAKHQPSTLAPDVKPE